MGLSAKRHCELKQMWLELEQSPLVAQVSLQPGAGEDGVPGVGDTELVGGWQLALPGLVAKRHLVW